MGVELSAEVEISEGGGEERGERGDEEGGRRGEEAEGGVSHEGVLDEGLPGEVCYGLEQEREGSRR